MNEGRLMFSSSTNNCCIGQLLITSLTKLQIENFFNILLAVHRDMTSGR